jgi:hypothetical protein
MFLTSHSKHLYKSRVENEQLYNNSNGLTKQLCKDFNRLDGILKGPVILDTFILEISSSISYVVYTGEKKKTLLE